MKFNEKGSKNVKKERKRWFGVQKCEKKGQNKGKRCCRKKNEVTAKRKTKGKECCMKMLWRSEKQKVSDIVGKKNEVTAKRKTKVSEH